MPGYWRKPLTLMYDHNYRYGTGLYTGTLDNVERRYRQALFRSHLNSDRPYYGSYQSYLSPYRSYWPSSTLSKGPTKKTYFYYDIPYYSLYSSPSYYSSYLSPSYYNYYSPYKYYRPSSYYYYDPYYYYSDYSHPSKYYSYRYPSYYDLYDTKRSSSDSNLRRSYSMDDLLDYKKTDDYWVPLSSYLYRSPSAVDLTDYDLKSGKKRWKELDDLEWELKSNKIDSYEAMYWADKCKDFQTKLDSVTRRMTEAESAVKEEVYGSRDKLQLDLTDLAYQLEETHAQNEELLKVIKKQAKQLTELQSNYDGVYKQIQDAADYLTSSREKCQSLQTELEELRSNVGVIEHKTRTTRYVY